MKGLIIALLLSLSAVSIDMPPPGFKLKTADAGVSSVAPDAGVRVKNLKELRLEARENFKVLEVLITAEAKKEVRVKSILFAQQSMTADRDAVIVNFSVKGESDFSMLFVRRGQDWQPYHDTFGEETP